MFTIVIETGTEPFAMVSAKTVKVRAEVNPAMRTVIGKAVESFTGDGGIIEVVGRL